MRTKAILAAAAAATLVAGGLTAPTPARASGTDGHSGGGECVVIDRVGHNKWGVVRVWGHNRCAANVKLQVVFKGQGWESQCIFLGPNQTFRVDGSYFWSRYGGWHYGCYV